MTGDGQKSSVYAAFLNLLASASSRSAARAPACAAASRPTCSLQPGSRPPPGVVITPPNEVMACPAKGRPRSFARRATTA